MSPSSSSFAGAMSRGTQDPLRLLLRVVFLFPYVLWSFAVKSIEDLSTIFKELAVLVIDQGTILDRIDFNMEQVRRIWSRLVKRNATKDIYLFLSGTVQEWVL